MHCDQPQKPPSPRPKTKSLSSRGVARLQDRQRERRQRDDVINAALGAAARQFDLLLRKIDFAAPQRADFVAPLRRVKINNRQMSP